MTSDKLVSVLEGLLVRAGGELVLHDLSRGVHVGDSARSQSEPVVRAEQGSHEGLTLGLVNLPGAVVVVLGPEVIEVSSEIGIDLILIHDVESSDGVSSPLVAGPLGELPDTGSGTHGVLLLNSIALEDVVQDVVLIGSVALGREVVGVGSIRALGGRSEGDTFDELDSLRLLSREAGSQKQDAEVFHFIMYNFYGIELYFKGSLL
mmetsp:Transcript_15932/g.24622  ORF Transcript_15932/g.24622 Transcript_15932/m.24622 type:complete len:206 (-) Transcript_15932:8-625(-)